MSARRFALAKRLQWTFLKICDLTQFYSPLSGGVKRYVHEKINYIQTHVTGRRTRPHRSRRENGGSRRRTFANLLDSFAAGFPIGALPRSPQSARGRRNSRTRTARYHRVERSVSGRLESGFRRPDRSEFRSSAFYHSHFPEAYLRGASKLLGSRRKSLMSAAQRYVRKLYNRFEATLVPSEPAGATSWKIGACAIRASSTSA